MNTIDQILSITLPLYRVRVVGADGGFRIIGFDRRLFSARREAALFSDCDGIIAIVEAYDRHTGETIRIVG